MEPVYARQRGRSLFASDGLLKDDRRLPLLALRIRALQKGIRMNEQYQLFKSDTCGFCYRVRAYVEQLGMDLPLRDINSDADAFRELLQGGGRSMVPCLRIERNGEQGTEVEWMYESLDIMRYLGGRQANL
jgi:glutaredoxin